METFETDIEELIDSLSNFMSEHSNHSHYSIDLDKALAVVKDMLRDTSIDSKIG